MISATTRKALLGLCEVDDLGLVLGGGLHVLADAVVVALRLVVVGIGAVLVLLGALHVLASTVLMALHLTVIVLGAILVLLGAALVLLGAVYVLEDVVVMAPGFRAHLAHLLLQALKSREDGGIRSETPRVDTAHLHRVRSPENG